MSNSVKILYIAGFERSGSTIVNRILGQIEGFIACGELRDTWQNGLISNVSCTCGVKFRECETWQKIINQGFGDINQIDPQIIITQMKQIKAQVLLASEDKIKSRFKEYLTYLEKLYLAIHHTTESKVIVDSSKSGWYGYVLKMIPQFKLYVVHIIRDPCGVCYSLQKHKLKKNPQSQWYNPVHASVSWDLKNLAVEYLLNSHNASYLRIRYEDFCVNPKLAIQSLLKFVQEETRELPFIDDFTVQMKKNHLLTGSPSSRSKIGTVKLQLDEQWKQEIKLTDKNLITSLTFPLLKKYGYL